MHRSTFASVAIAALFAVPALAAPPKMLSVTEKVTINAPATKVWDAVKNYDALPSWHPGFAKDEIVKGENNKVGAVRQLTIKDGPTFTEELLAFSEKAKSYKYKIIESPLPIDAYSSTLTVKSVGKNKSQIVWNGTFKRKNADANPPEGESDAGVSKLIHGVYRGGLDNVKSMTEK